MGCYRRKLDIIADILSVATVGARKTRIMYQANLSYNVLQKYITEIVEASLMSFQAQSRCYLTTEKGLDFLRTYKEYQKSSKSIERRQNETRIKQSRLSELCSVF